MDSNEIDEIDRKSDEEKNAGRRSGLLQGFLLGVLLMLAICTVAVAVIYRSGMLIINTDSGIYMNGRSDSAYENMGMGSKAAQKLNLIDKVLDDFYFDDVDDEKVLDNICKAYVNSYGDKYTTYYTAEEFAKFNEANSGEYCGIGVVVRKNDDGNLLVVEPYEGSPGKEAGIRKNDVIISVNGEAIADEDISDIVARIKGKEGTTVDVGIKREGVDDTINMTITRRKVEVKTVEYKMVENSIGYISIDEFDKVTAQQFKKGYDELKSQGMKGLIVDIRSNPGGLLSTVIDMLDEILPDGLILYTEDKYGKRVEYNGTNPNVADVPIAVLVDGGSASASEIFAGAIQDYGIGTIIGTQTFGKGIVQETRRMSDGSAIKFTISKYYTPKAQDIHGRGITPDVVVELSEEFKNLTEYDEGKDNQLQTAISVLQEKIN